MKTKKIFFCVVFIYCSINSFCQKGLVIKTNTPSFEISNIKEAFVTISIKPRGPKGRKIQVPIRCGSKQGKVRVELYKKNIDTYTKEEIVDFEENVQIREYENKEFKKYLSISDSVIAKYYLPLFIKKGEYKFRCYYIDVSRTGLKHYYSNWLFFKIAKDLKPEAAVLSNF